MKTTADALAFMLEHLATDPTLSPDFRRGLLDAPGVRELLGVKQLRWDGIDTLTVDGEPWFKIMVATRQGLAEAIVKIALPDVTPTEDDLERFCVEVLKPLDHQPFVMQTDAVAAWWRRRC